MTKQNWAFAATLLAFWSIVPGNIKGDERKPGDAGTYQVANSHITRIIDVSHGHLMTKIIASPSKAASVDGGDEFAVVIGPDKKRITAGEFRITAVKSIGNPLSFVLQHAETGLRAELEYRVTGDDFYMRKTINFKNEGKTPVQILDIEVESLRFASAKAGGVGHPVYAEGKLFLGLEFPLGQNEQKDGLITLRHLPGRTLQPGEQLQSKTAVEGAASEKETVEEAFDRYVRHIALRKPEVMTVYGNWARYDYLSDGLWPDEKIVLETVDELAKMRDAGWQCDYYVMDAGWFDEKGDYTVYRKPAWPDGPERMVKAINNVGIKYGLWFDTGGGIPNYPGIQPSKKPDGRMCLASGPYIDTFKKALLKQIEDLGLTMIKFDFATFDCGSDKHGHLLGDYAKEASLTSFLEMLDAVRKTHPQVKYIIFNGFHRSPWWLMHIDTIYCGDPAPSDTPTLRLRDSINLKTDASVQEHRFEHLLPWYAIDDCGLMIGDMGTIYWIDAEEFRKTWMLDLGRGNLMPFIYGDLRLFDDSDRKFIVKMWRLVRDNAQVFADTRTILGRPNGAEVYGYSHFKDQHGFVFLNNPTFEQKTVVIKLDALHSSITGPLGVSEIFPVECVYAAADKIGFKPDEEIRMELAPFEVRALEVKPVAGDVTGAVSPRQSASVSIPIPVKLAKQTSEWLTDAMIDMANKELTHLIEIVTTRIEKPSAVTRSGLKGIYSFSLELPKFDKPRTLALPVRFMAEGRPVRNRDPNKCALAVAWFDGGQIILDMTPKAHIWSGCSWLTFHMTLDPSFSGKKIELLALNMSLEGAGLEMEKAYLLSGAR